MLKSLKLCLLIAAFAVPALAEGPHGLGRNALPEEIAAWNIDVSPDGTGLPDGSGDVLTGEEVFAEKCAACHGDFAEGVDNWPKLAGGIDTLADEDPLKTVGSYWPYLSTVFDYVNRSMPFGQAQTLTADEVYAMTAYILYSNDIVVEDFVLSKENFLEVPMHNADSFILDDRAETEYAIWSGEPCMENCKQNVEITMRATVLNVTPDEEMASDDMAADHADTPASEVAVEIAAVEPAVKAPTPAAIDPELVAAGKRVFNKCKACHMVGDGAKNRTGPELNGIVGAAIGGKEGFKYSKAFAEANAAGRVWDQAELSDFLANPRSHMKGTKMSFAGLKKQEEIDSTIAYLSTFGN